MRQPEHKEEEAIRLAKKAAIENPDLPYKFIKELLLSLQEIEDGEVEKYKFGTDDLETQ